MIVPAFAVGRTQQIVLVLHKLAEEKAIPAIPIFVDSPLAVNVTEVFRHHPEEYDSEAAAYLAARTRSIRLQPAALSARRRRQQDAKRSADAVCCGFGLGHV